MQICKDHDKKELVLCVYRLRITQSNLVGTDVKKWGEAKAADLAKEQGEHTISALTNVLDVWMYPKSGSEKKYRPRPNRLWGHSKGHSGAPEPHLTGPYSPGSALSVENHYFGP